MADYAIHDTTLTAIADVIRDKDGSFDLIDPANFAEKIDWFAKLTETTTTASDGVIVTCAKNKPITSWVTSLPVMQEGTGNPTPSNVRPFIMYNGAVSVFKGGKNILDPTSFVHGLPSSTLGDSMDDITESTEYSYATVYSPSTMLVKASVTNTNLVNKIAIYAYDDAGDLVKYWDFADANGYSKAATTITYGYIRICISAASGYDAPTDISNSAEILLTSQSNNVTYQPYTPIETFTETFSSFYGGEWDVTGGKKRSTYYKLSAIKSTDIKSVQQIPVTGGTAWQVTFGKEMYETNNAQKLGYCDKLKFVTSTSTLGSTTDGICFTDTAAKKMVVRSASIASVSDVSPLLTGLTIVYPRKTPTETSCTPHTGLTTHGGFDYFRCTAHKASTDKYTIGYWSTALTQYIQPPSCENLSF